jgi:hypothetical protein
VALAPDIPVTQELKKWLQTSASLTEFKFFKNNDEINDYIQNIDYGREGGLIKLCFGVVFSKYENGVYDYTLRYNVSDLGTSMFDVNKLGVDIPDPKHPRIDATLK